MARRYVPDSAVSFRLEEPISVPYRVVGTPEWIAKRLPEHMSPKLLIPVHGKASLEPVCKAMESVSRLMVDTESSGPREMDGLDAVSPSSEVVLGQIGTKNEIFVIEPALLPEFSYLLESDRWLKVLQNAVHDFRFLYAKYGIHMNRMYCTMLAEQVLTAGKEGVGVGLADLVRKYAPNRIISKNVREDFIQFSGRFTRRMLYYAARDVFLLPPVFEKQWLWLKEWDLTETATREFRIIPATAEMGLTGVLADETYLQQTIDYFTGVQAAAQEKIFTIYNECLQKLGLVKTNLFGDEYETFNLKSHPEKRAALKRIGIEVENTEADTLARLDHPIGKPLAEWSSYTKNLDNYGQPLLDRRHWYTGRIHPDFDQLGAGENAQRNGRDKKETIATGRYSSNFQQLPRPDKILAKLTGEQAARVRVFFASKIADIEAIQKAA